MEAFGQSHGGFTNKIHARCDIQGRPLGGRETSDYLAAPALLNMVVPKPKAMLADKGCDGDDVRFVLLIHGSCR